VESTTRKRVYGVDFSGAKDAGRRIWIATGSAAGETLQIECCLAAKDLPGSSRERDSALRALRELIARESRAAVGLDFPFGLPQALCGYSDWESFVLAFPNDYPSPEVFRAVCRAAAQGRELRRLTDEVARTPFSPYNIRIYRQTYYGIRDLLRPLVEKDRVRVLPMQMPAADRASLLEICPASTLKRQGLYMPYKGDTASHRSARQRILQAFERNRITLREETLRATILQDAGGDALDSVVAALTTFDALRTSAVPDPTDSSVYAVEGYVYVGDNTRG
jgi:hypothetical protein